MYKNYYFQNTVSVADTIKQEVIKTRIKSVGSCTNGNVAVTLVNDKTGYVYKFYCRPEDATERGFKDVMNNKYCQAFFEEEDAKVFLGEYLENMAERIDASRAKLNKF